MFVNMKLISPKPLILPGLMGILCLLTIQCSKQEQPKILASVNSANISVQDFEENYFNTILYGNTFDSPEKRRRHLDYLIDTYVLAQKGINRGAITESDLEKVVRRTIRRKTKMELLKKEVEKKTPPPQESDLKRIFSYNNQKVHVRHLFAKTKHEIDSIYNVLESGVGFKDIAQSIFEDSTLKSNGGDLGWCSYGDLDPFLEDTLFKMLPGQYSKPVQSRFGWHILKLENRSYNPLLSQTDFEKDREKLSTQFKKREQDKLYYSFINKFMANKTATIHNPQWGILMREIRRQYPPNQQMSPVLMQLPYSPEIKSTAVREILDDPLITFPNHVMTVNEFLDWATDQPTKSFYGSLKALTEQIIMDYFLFQEGKQRGLNESRNVKNSVIFEKNVFAGLKYRNMLLSNHYTNPDSLDVSAVQVAYDSLKEKQYVQSRKISYSQIVVADSNIAIQCLNKIRNGTPFDDIITKYGIQKAGVLESGHFTRDSKEIPGPLLHLILDLENEAFSEIVTLNNRYIILQRCQIQTDYHPLSEVEEELRRTLSKNIARRIVADSLKVWKKHSDISINYSLLDSLYKE